MFETRKSVMAILHWKQGLLCDKNQYRIEGLIQDKGYSRHSDKNYLDTAESVCLFSSNLTHYQIGRILTHLRYGAVENITRKGEIAYNKQFLLF